MPSNDMLDRLEDERRESGRRALAAQEEVRRRIARELHKGGRLSVRPAPGGGTEVVLDVPVPEGGP